jgi:hypothetical protein
VHHLKNLAQHPVCLCDASDKACIDEAAPYCSKRLFTVCEDAVDTRSNQDSGIGTELQLLKTFSKNV